MIKYCVVINSFKRPLELVEKSLRSVLSQKNLPEKLILIDQNEVPLDLSSDLKTHTLLEVQKSSSRSVSGARNGVILPDDCQWICFCDDDGYWDSDYSKELQILLARDQMDVIAGSVLRSDTMGFYSLRHKWGGDMRFFHNLKLLMGSNFCVRREVFEIVGRFDSRFGAGAYWGSSEETDFAWKCFFAGKKLNYQPQLKVIHLPPFNESLKKGFNKSYCYAVGKGALVGKWLIEKKKLPALAEFGEMLIVPLIQIFRGTLTFTPELSLNNLGVFWGRLSGFIKFIILKWCTPRNSNLL